MSSLNIGLSGLLVNQRLLDLTGHGELGNPLSNYVQERATVVAPLVRKKSITRALRAAIACGFYGCHGCPPGALRALHRLACRCGAAKTSYVTLDCAERNQAASRSAGALSYRTM